MAFGKAIKGKLEGIDLTDEKVSELRSEIGADFVMVFSLKHGVGVQLTTMGSVSQEETKGIIKALKDTAAILSDEDKIKDFTDENLIV